MSKLTATKVASKKLAPGKYGDGNGLMLLVKQSGARSWVVRLTVDGRQRDYGLGGYPAVSLHEARHAAAALRDRVRVGGDPADDKRRDIPSFEDLARLVHSQKLPGFRSDIAAAEWWNRLRRHAIPTLGGLRVDRITRDDVLSVLDPIWTAKNHTARKVRDGIAQVMRAAMARGWIDHNPAGEVIAGALLRQPAGGNLAAVSWADVPAVMALLADHDGSDVLRLVLSWQILTAARPGEARGTLWAEIDFEAATWTLPGARMKSGRDHVVPLSSEALGVLEQARGTLWAGSPLVFPSPRDPQREIDHGSVGRLLKRLGVLAECGRTATAHGFRSSFKTWAIESTPTPWAVSEAALAHRVGDGVSSRYVRGTLFEQRRALMDQWGSYCAMPAEFAAPDTAEALARS